MTGEPGNLYKSSNYCATPDTVSESIAMSFLDDSGRLNRLAKPQNKAYGFLYKGQESLTRRSDF